MNAKLSFMLDVRRLRVLHAVSAYGSVTAAAAALGYSAPAVSQQLAALEREVGMRLTERAGRGVELTPAAHILVGHTDALLARLDAAEADLATLRDQIAGRVTLAAFPSAAASLGPAAWTALAGSGPPGGAAPPREGSGGVPARRAPWRDGRGRGARVRPAAPASGPALRAPRAARRPRGPGHPRGQCPFAGPPRPGPAGRTGRPAVPRPPPGDQLRRDDPAGLRPGRFRAPRGRPGQRLPGPSQPGRGRRGRHPGARAGRPVATAASPAGGGRRPGDPPGLHGQPPRRRPQARGPRRPGRPVRRGYT